MFATELLKKAALFSSLLAWALTSRLGVGTALAADQFYEELLRSGVLAYQQKDYATAIEDLQIANFGLMDEPESLVRGLVHLALAFAEVPDREGFQQASIRLARLQEEFGAYLHSDLDEEVRISFEQKLKSLLDKEVLASVSPLLSPESTPTPDLPVETSPREEFQLKMKEQPQESQWPSALAQLEFAEGNEKAAFKLATKAVELDPRNSEAWALRGRIQLLRGKWKRALQDFQRSGLQQEQEQVAAEYLQALIAMERWQESEVFLLELPENIRWAPLVDAQVGRLPITPTLTPSPPAEVFPQNTPLATPVLEATALVPTPTSTMTPSPRVQAPRQEFLELPSATATPLAMANPVVEIAKVGIEEQDEFILLKVHTEKELAQYRQFRLDSPERLVFDLLNTTSKKSLPKNMTVGRRGVERIRFAVYEDWVRIVVDTNEPGLQAQIISSPEQLLIRLALAP